MSIYKVKARHNKAEILGEKCFPEEGWFFVIDIPLSEIPSRDFSVKRPKHKRGEPCPKCGQALGLNHRLLGSDCPNCGFESDWVYARYNIVWRG